ncbi:TetR/AcrR family transcriptional regulator [Bacillus velezensis]|uniref:TetR/AcrR family transcriptional regulator n=1 Tax=Bacillus velezensis TaxID=492670 RepID=UPI002FFFF279
MNDRKQRVVKIAHELFIEKGYQATSIQDILEYSGISKGTFYNYFSSKSDLLIALFQMIYSKLEQERNELLIGQEPSNINIFIKQMELILQTNRNNKLFTLFEEVIFINDIDLKHFIKQGNFKMLNWLYSRFLDIFGDSKEPYLLDCAIMFIGILHHNIKYYDLAEELDLSVHEVVKYSVERVVKIVEEVSLSGVQLIKPEVLKNWVPACKTSVTIQQELNDFICKMKKKLIQCEEQAKYQELLEFIHNECNHTKNPRKFLIESTLSTLNKAQSFFGEKELQKLHQLVALNIKSKNPLE